MDISIRNLFKAIWSNIYKHIFTYIFIATLLQLAMLAGLWFVGRVFQFSLSLAGETNLDKNNIASILGNPYSLIILLLLILIVAFLMFIEFSTLTFTIYGQLTENSYSLRTIISNAWEKMRSLVGFQILFFIGYFILTIPAANFGVKSIVTKNLYIPKFVTGEIMKTNTGFIIWSLVVVLFAYINLRLIFTLPLTAVGDTKIGASIKTSWKFTQKGKFKFLLTLGLFELIYSVIVITIILATTAIFLYIDPTGNNLIIQTFFSLSLVL
ncbi:glycerophosphoryl diester phosphodiesterase membrane domain-containing protein [Gemella morbillorum]